MNARATNWGTNKPPIFRPRKVQHFASTAGHRNEFLAADAVECSPENVRTPHLHVVCVDDWHVLGVCARFFC